MGASDIQYRGNFLPVEGSSLVVDKHKKNGINEKLHVYNWLHDVPPSADPLNQVVEVRFKNTRKAFYHNLHGLRLVKGDIVAVEASPGHDIGIVSLTGDLVRNQIVKYGIDSRQQFQKIYRKAKPNDIDKWQEAIALEHETMIQSRQIANDLKLNMKIGDVEYQGDKTKAIFYYIADERVDFRQLIKVLAERFRVRIEMKQIGARQEAGRIGGIGPCGRSLCCATWMSNFVSVTTNSARLQEVSLNPQKLAGQCGKLKCCLNYELECYLDAQQDFPPREIPLETVEQTFYYQKSDFFRGLLWYSSSKDAVIDFTPVPVERVKEIQELNKQGKKVKKLNDIALPLQAKTQELDYKNVVGEDSLTRFQNDKKKRNKRRNNKNRNKNNNRN